MTCSRDDDGAMSAEELVRPIHILLIEDSPVDAKLMVMLFQKLKTPCDVSVVRDGEAAIAFLKRQEAYQNSPTPKLILLDLNLPKKSGLEVLAEIRADPELRMVPVIVMSASESPDDCRRCYENLANSYLVKPASIRELEQIMKALEGFWLQCALLPVAPRDISF